MSLDLAVVEKADFLTLQGTVWSKAAGQGPVDPESSRNGRNRWVAQTLGKGGGPTPGVCLWGSEGAEQGKGVCAVAGSGAGWGRECIASCEKRPHGTTSLSCSSQPPLLTRAGFPVTSWGSPLNRTSF